MSKKIIAIALFVTMLLSLASVANAYTIDGMTNGDVVNLAGTNTGFAKSNVLSGANNTITITGDYSLIDDISNTWNSDEDRVFAVYFTATTGIDAANDLRLDSALYNDSVNGNGGTLGAGSRVGNYIVPIGGATTTALSIWAPFVARRGGNTQTYTLTYRTADNTVTTKTLTVNYVDTGAANKPVRSMSLNAITDPYMAGNYSAYMMGNVLFIDYDKAVLDAKLENGTLYDRMEFQFFSNGARIPASGKYAYALTDYTTDAAVDASAAFDKPANITTSISTWLDDATAIAAAKTDFFVTESLPVRNTTPTRNVVGTGTRGNTGNSYINNGDNEELEFFINPAISNFKIKLEDENYLYESGEIRIQWRAVPRNEITNVNVGESVMTLVLGETKAADLSAAHASTYTKLTMTDVGYSPIVYIDGKNITGTKIGTTTIRVSNEQGVVVAAFVVNVVAAPPAVTNPIANITNQYRVIASGNLNVRSGPGTTYGIVGKVNQTNILSGVEMVAGTDGGQWLKLANNAGYVSARYVAALASGAATTGNYVVTASSLNVRSAPNGSIVGRLARNTTVSVTAFNAGWAQLTNGNWVSSAYLRAA